MEVRVLGPVELVSGGRQLALAPMPRRLLAALATRAGETCSADLLVEALWGEVPPASGAKLVQVYVSQLRKALPERDAIRTRGPGYALELKSGVSLDALRFERLLAESREAASAANLLLAASLLRRALSLWRGAAFGDFAYEEFARTEAERLEELRVVCLEERIEAELTLGHHRELLAEALALAASHPLRERSQANAILALYRCGRQARALELYGVARTRLRDELGLEPGAELRELQQKILRHDATLAASPAAQEPVRALPAPPNELIGRQRELAELVNLLLREDVRLLVLAGAGGSGKTRLAIEAARQAVTMFANGVVFVSLASVRDPKQVAVAIADAAGVQATAGEEILQTLAVALRSREVLLVLDNAEQIRSAELFAELLAEAPRLRLLVTSRVVLHLSGERVYPVQPLALADAAELFRQRASAADPAVEFDAAQAEAIARICARLDGLPLAVELAAGHARTMTAHELLARLDRRLPLLAGGARDLPARQQTLRATLEWSYGLLNDAEAQLFRRMSVFAAASTLEAIEAVCEGTQEVLASLVDHNLVNRTVMAAGSRFAMLETAREFAQQRLLESPEAERVRRHHAAFVLRAAEGARDRQPSDCSDAGSAGSPQPDPGEMRAAVEWSLAARDRMAPRLVVAAGRHWHAQGRLVEGRDWIEAALALDGEGDTVRAELLGLLASVLYDRGDRAAAGRAVSQARELARRAGSERVEGWVRALGAEFQLALGSSLRDSLVECEAAVRLLERAGDQAGIADGLTALGRLRFWCGERSAAADALMEAVALARETGNRAAELLALESRALLYVDLAEPTDVAIAEQKRLLQAARGAPRAEAGILVQLARQHAYAGRFGAARAALGRSKEMFEAFEATAECGYCAMNAGVIELLAGDPVVAEREFRGAHALLQQAGDQPLRITVAAWRAESLYARGRYAQAAQIARQARREVIEDDREVQIRTRLVEAKVSAQNRNARTAKQLLNEAERFVRAAPARSSAWASESRQQPEAPRSSLLGSLILARGEVLQLLGEFRQAVDAYGAAHVLYREKHAWPLAERAQRLLEVTALRVEQLARAGVQTRAGRDLRILRRGKDVLG